MGGLLEKLLPEIQRHNVQEKVEKVWESLNCKGKSGRSQWKNYGGPPELVGPLDPPLLLSLSLERITKSVRLKGFKEKKRGEGAFKVKR